MKCRCGREFVRSLAVHDKHVALDGPTRILKIMYCTLKYLCIIIRGVIKVKIVWHPSNFHRTLQSDLS